MIGIFYYKFFYFYSQLIQYIEFYLGNCRRLFLFWYQFLIKIEYFEYFWIIYRIIYMINVDGCRWKLYFMDCI